MARTYLACVDGFEQVLVGEVGQDINLRMERGAHYGQTEATRIHQRIHN